MKYAALFLTLGPALVIEAVVCRGLYCLLVWPGMSLTLVGLAYLRLGPSVFGKKSDGTMAWYSVALLLPYLLAVWVVWHVARIVGREDCYNEAAPGLLVGRRPRSNEVPNEVSLVVDLAAEFIECRAVRTGHRYISAPVLDTGVKRVLLFVAAVTAVAGNNQPPALELDSVAGTGGIPSPFGPLDLSGDLNRLVPGKPVIRALGDEDAVVVAAEGEPDRGQSSELDDRVQWFRAGRTPPEEGIPGTSLRHGADTLHPCRPARVTRAPVEAVWVSMATVLQLSITWMNWGRP